MKILAFFCLLAIAFASGEECGEERGEACVDALLDALLTDTSEEEVCRELRNSVNCLRTAADECLEEKNDEVEEGLEELGRILRENCGDEGSNDDDDDEKMAKCFEENEDYMFECIFEGASQAMDSVDDISEADEDSLLCLTYALTAQCFIERVEEKCGKQAAQLAERELKDAPRDVKEACEASPAFDWLDERKKK